MRGGDKPKHCCHIAFDVSVGAGFKVGWFHIVGDSKLLGSFAIRIPSTERKNIGFYILRFFRELFLDPLHRVIHGAVVEPEDHPEREKVFTSVDFWNA